MSTLDHIEGHVPPLHMLNPLQRIKELNTLGRALTHYGPADLWEMDTVHLPAALGHLRRRVRQFAQTHMAPHVRLLDEAEHAQPGTLHPAARQLLVKAGYEGLMSNVVPAPLGSASLWDMRFSPAYRMAIQVEEMSAVCAGQMLLLSAHQLGLAPVLLSGDLKAMWRFIRPMHQDFMQGRPHLFAYAITEPTAGSDAEDGHGAHTNRPRVVARRVTGGYRISGQKCYISGGDVARKVAVFAALEGEGFDSWTCFMLDASNPGMSARRTELKMGMRASSAAELTFEDAFVSDADVIGGLRKGWALNRATLNASRYPVAAMAVGIARRACELALNHAMDTRLGGRPLISYQEVQLQLAQMVAETRTIRSLLWQQASGSQQARQAGACISKFMATDRAQAICEMGMALMAEHGTRTAAWHLGQSALPGMYVADLPVTTAAAHAAGHDCWGYPKIIVPIDFQLRDRDLDCGVRSEDGQAQLCRLHGRIGAGVKMSAPNLMTYTLFKGQLWRTVINTRGRMRHALGGDVTLQCDGGGDHPLSQRLRALGLHGATPLMVQSIQGMQAILPAGVPVT